MAGVKGQRVLTEQERMERVIRMAELYESGLSTRQVAQQLGSSQSSVQKLLVEHGVQMRPPHHPGPGHTSRVRLLYWDGQRQHVIGYR